MPSLVLSRKNRVYRPLGDFARDNIKRKDNREKKSEKKRKYSVEDFVRVARTGLTRKITETKTSDGVRIDQTVDIQPETRTMLRTMGSLSGSQRFHFDVNNASYISTNGSGDGSTILTMDPSGAGNWTELAAIFDQFRVLGATLEVTQGGNNAAGVFPYSVICAFDNDSSPSPSLATLVQYQNFAFGSLNCYGNRPFRYSCRRPDLGEYPFISTTTPALSLGSIPVFSRGAISITNALTFTLRLHCEFVGIR